MTRPFPLALFAAAVLAASVAHAQDPSSVLVQVDYMSVEPGGETEYVDVELDLWKPIHEERRRRGDLLDWAVYEVSYAAPDSPYDYVTVNVYTNAAQMEGGDWNASMQAAYPDADRDALMDRTRAAREIVHTELWAILGSVQHAGEERPTGQYIAFNYMAVPTRKGSDYVEMERGVWAPIHQARTERGSMSGWALYSLVLPRGATMEYNYATADFFDDMPDVLGRVTWDMMSEAHGGAPRSRLEEMAAETEEVRTIHKTELWTRIDGLDAPATASTDG